MLRFADVSLGTGGWPRCERCGDAAEPTAYRDGADVLAEVVGIVDAWSDPPGPNVVLGGAEPFGHPALPAIVAGCVEAGVVRLVLETDADALTAGANARGAIDAGVRALRLRLACGCEESRQGRSLAGVAAFRDAAQATGVRVAVTALLEVCAHTCEDAAASVARLAEGAVDLVRIEGTGELGSGAALALAAACDTGVVNGVWVEAHGLPLPESHASHRAEEAVGG